MLNKFKQIKKGFNINGVFIAIYFVLALIVINSFLTYNYKKALNENIQNQLRYDEIKKHKDNILVNLNNIDMSVRGYVLVGNKAFLETLTKIKGFHEADFRALNETVFEVGLQPNQLSKIQGTVDQYFVLMDTVIELTQAGKMDRALSIIKSDPGTAVWERYVEFSKILDPLVEKKKAASSEAYNKLLAMTIIFNVILFFIGVPTLLYAATRLRKNRKNEKTLYRELDAKNREMIFNSNERLPEIDQATVVNGIIKNLSRTSGFIEEISKGNFEIEWEGMNEENKDLNKNNIAGSLLLMRDEMKKKQVESEKRQWASEGLTKLSDLLRNNQEDFKVLTETTIAFLVNYINAQQGGLFLLVEDEKESKPYLELDACYAFSRKKFLNKRIDLGEGLVGQTFLEAEPVYLTKIPESYVKIQSALGDAKPNSLIVFPLKHNEKVVGVIELASFRKYDGFVMDFLADACRTIAASIVNIRTNEKTRVLLIKSQQQAEEMRAQEEEMRQNMEELEATQEEMKRKEIELRNLLNQQQNEAGEESLI